MIMLLLGMALLAYFVFRQPEPAWQGRRLSAWLQELVELGFERPAFEANDLARHDWEDRHQKAVAAIQAIGPKALPHLMKCLRVTPKPSPLRDKLQELLQKQSFIKITLPQRRYQGEQAIAGFEALGPIATPALPELKELLLDVRYSEVAAASLYAIGPVCLPVLAIAVTNTDYRVQYHALQSLVQLAPQIGLASVPVLVNAITNSRCQYHRDALLGLGDLGNQARHAAASLESTMLDPSNILRGATMRVLAEISQEPNQYVPFFAERISNTNFSKDAAFALARVGTDGVPALLNALTNENRLIKRAALEALRPEFRKHPTAALADRRFSSLSSSFDSRSAIEFRGRPDLEVESIALRLAELLKNTDSALRLQIANLLGRYGHYSALGLSRAAVDQDLEVRARAKAALAQLEVQVSEGALVRGPQAEKKIALIFGGHEYVEGAATILDELDRHKARASFFLTGDFLVNEAYQSLIRHICDRGHYLGPHSDKHLLCCSWDESKRTLVTREEFWADFQENLNKLGELLGVAPAANQTRTYFFLPAYERYNLDVVEWASDFFFVTLAPTPGVVSTADVIDEGDPKFVSSKRILDSIISREQQDPHGLNGFVLLFHLGSGPNRKDKLHRRFGELLDYLSAKGYQFVSVDDLFDPKTVRENRAAH